MVYCVEVVQFHDYHLYNWMGNSTEVWTPGHHSLFLLRTLNSAASPFKNVNVIF